MLIKISQIGHISTIKIPEFYIRFFIYFVHLFVSVNLLAFIVKTLIFNKVVNYELNIDFKFHSLRHTHATLLIQNGANIKDVQARLGHASIETTLDTYTHSTEDSSRNTTGLFEQISKMKGAVKKVL